VTARTSSGLLICCALALLSPVVNAADTLRAIFDEDPGWAYAPVEIDSRLQRAQEAGFNVYVVNVWHGRGSLYPSTDEVSDDKLRQRMARGWDPLEYAIRKAHELRMELHPWFTVVHREDDRHPQFYGSGVPEGAYDVHNRAFREFIVGAMLDVVRRYDVDGINLDYIRSMGVCTSSACAADYTAYGGFDLHKDYAAAAGTSEARTRIQAWQDKAVGEIVFHFAEEARRLKPGAIISVDGYGEPQADKRALEGRNEIDWLNRGWIDAIYHMDYRPQPQVEQIERARAALRDPDRLHVLLGNYERVGDRVISRDAGLLASNVALLQKLWPRAGVAVYLLGRLDVAQATALRAGPFKKPAAPEWVQSP